MDLAAINLIRQANGQEPLTELPNESGAAATKTPEELEAEKKAIEDKAKQENQDKPTTTEDAELSDEQILKLLEKKGIKVNSFEDLKKPETPLDPKLVAEQREAEELAFGLNKGLFNKKDYDGFVSDSNDTQNFVFAQYHADAKADDPELTDEEIQEEFRAKFGLDAEPGTRKHKRGIKEINTIAESLLKQKYGKIYDAKTAFSSYEKEATTAKENKTKLDAGLPVYSKDVEDIFTKMKKIPVKFSDTETIEVDAIQDHLNELKEMMMKPEYAKGKVLSGYKKETLEQEAFAALLYKNFPSIAKEIANQHLLKHSAGTKGIPLLGGKAKDNSNDLVPTEAQKKMRELNEKHNPQPASAN